LGKRKQWVRYGSFDQKPLLKRRSDYKAYKYFKGKKHEQVGANTLAYARRWAKHLEGLYGKSNVSVVAVRYREGADYFVIYEWRGKRKKLPKRRK
jgi:hypothetical protein